MDIPITIPFPMAKSIGKAIGIYMAIFLLWFYVVMVALTTRIVRGINDVRCYEIGCNNIKHLFFLAFSFLCVAYKLISCDSTYGCVINQLEMGSQ